MWCMHTYDQCKVGNKQAADWNNHKKLSSGSITREQAMSAMINIFVNHDESSNEKCLIRPTWEVPF